MLDNAKPLDDKKLKKFIWDCAKNVKPEEQQKTPRELFREMAKDDGFELASGAIYKNYNNKQLIFAIAVRDGKKRAYCFFYTQGMMRPASIWYTDEY